MPRHIPSRRRWWQSAFVHALLLWPLMAALPAQAMAPTVNSISPAVGPTAGGQEVTIRGTGFTGATSVTIGGATCTPPFPQSSDSYYSCTTGARAAGNSLSVDVTTPSGTNAPNTLYTYADVAPTVSSISPAVGPTAGGQGGDDQGHRLYRRYQRDHRRRHLHTSVPAVVRQLLQLHHRCPCGRQLAQRGRHHAQRHQRAQHALHLCGRGSHGQLDQPLPSAPPPAARR
ncbi:MAG: IPT/TIG domain-containing protein [Burkholderiales bacterium]|nr:IPT/TIG domain-containing protein [Burkholderiales bacterium]